MHNSMCPIIKIENQRVVLKWLTINGLTNFSLPAFFKTSRTGSMHLLYFGARCE